MNSLCYYAVHGGAIEKNQIISGYLKQLLIPQAFGRRPGDFARPPAYRLPSALPGVNRGRFRLAEAGNYAWQGAEELPGGEQEGRF